VERVSRAARQAVWLEHLAIDPDVLKAFTEAAPQALNQMIAQPEPPGLSRLLRDFFWNQDFRHGLAAVNTMLEVFGRNWSNSRRQHNGAAVSATVPTR
jgi:hypothetical protein